ncbi:MAG: DedA family protein [Actinomycetota bacterium]
MLDGFVTREIASYGYAAIFVLMLLESACIPIPSEVTMLFGGALVTAPLLAADQQLSFALVVAAGVGGNVVGSWLAYWLGAAGGRPLLERWGRYLLLRPHEIDRAHAWFERRGPVTVFVGRLLPVVRTFISLPAGVAGMDLGRFTAYTILGCIPWCVALTWIGAGVGQRWETIAATLQPFSWAIAVGVVLATAWWIRRRLADRNA